MQRHDAERSVSAILTRAYKANEVRWSEFRQILSRSHTVTELSNGKERSRF